MIRCTTAANFPKEWELFSKIDANHDGSLDREEIRAMLQQDMGWDDYANDLCEELDANGDGLVSFAEFVIGFQRFCDKAFTPNKNMR
jgi:Ca2+-binding EF-hand superfamily protein